MGQNERAQRVKKAEAIYESKLRSELGLRYAGQYIAIDPDTEEYFIGSSVREACLQGSQKHPGRKLVCLRVGHLATRFVGCRG
ncbi:MAG: hypothetical protein NTY77_07510 [Elusimicrobia bacterium]|nr:hypothetical protein [Elusimicrobiota bacterium]